MAYKISQSNSYSSGYGIYEKTLNLSIYSAPKSESSISLKYFIISYIYFFNSGVKN